MRPKRAGKHLAVLLIGLGAAATVLVAVPVRYVCCMRGPDAAQLQAQLQRAQSTAEQERLIIELIRQAWKDAENWRARGRMTDSKLTRLLGAKFWDRVYPNTYASQKLLSQGASIIEPLLRIVRDPKQDEQIVGWAWRYLLEFDDPSVFKALHEAVSRKRMPASEAADRLRYYLPAASMSRRLENGAILGLLEDLATDYGETCLDLLDELMRTAHKDGGLDVRTFDWRVLQWLNRFYDYDLDEWLAEKAPEALAFRNAQLERGYDPAGHSFYIFYARLRSYDGITDEGIKAVFSGPQERKACRQLIEAVYELSSPLRPPRKEGWLDRLRVWYWDNRDSFVYDFDKHRFVVKKPDARR